MGSPFVAVYRRDLNPYINPRSQGGFVRFFIAMFSHETNTFSTLPSDRRQFEARDLRYGRELLEPHRGTGTCLGGMTDVAEASSGGGHAHTHVQRLAAGLQRRATAADDSPLRQNVACQQTARRPICTFFLTPVFFSLSTHVIVTSVYTQFPRAQFRGSSRSRY